MSVNTEEQQEFRRLGAALLRSSSRLKHIGQLCVRLADTSGFSAVESLRLQGRLQPECSQLLDRLKARGKLPVDAGCVHADGAPPNHDDKDN